MKLTLVLLGALALVGCSSSGSEEVQDEAGAPESPAGATPGSAMPGAPGTPGTGTPGAPGTPGNPTSDASTPLPDGGDAGPVTPPAGAGVFAGTPAYVATLGPSTLDTKGQGQGHLSFNAAGNPAGKACLDCHAPGVGKAPDFLFGGTIYEDAAGTKPAARVEVRMVGSDGKGASAYTDINGNYFVRANAATVVAPATAGARNAAITQLMANKINNGNCNQCHGATDRITL